MKGLRLTAIILTTVAFLMSTNAYSGNDQRIGSSGASELLINPWAMSTGWGEANVACVVGLEAMYQNVAGMAMINRSEFVLNHARYIAGTSISSGGFATKVGENGVLGASVSTMSFGEIERTTGALPDGGIGTFKPNYTTIGIAYSREFSNSIYGGITVKLINESIENVGAMGFCFDAGIQYVTGIGRNKAGGRNRDNLHFGITMKNVGTTMSYVGDGMTFTGHSEYGTVMTVEQRSQEFELPSLIKIGFSYKFRLAPVVDKENEEVTSKHNLTIAANFTANSFTRDQLHFGLEYEFHNILFIRGGYCYEKGLIGDKYSRETAFTGPSCGMTLQCPLNKEKKSVIGIDYSYRFTNPFGGVHTMGIRISI